MTRGRRMLKIAKWTTLVFAFVLGFFCGPWELIRVGPDHIAGLGGGGAWYLRGKFWPRPLVLWQHCRVGGLGPQFAWPWWGEGWVKFAPFAVLLAIGFAVLWNRDRRWRLPPDHCSNCGYNLTANTTGRCPECGRDVAPAGEHAS